MPGAPLAVAATVSTATSIQVTWKAPTSNGGSALTGYTATCTSSGAPTISKGVAATVLKAVVTGAVSGDTYTCTVTATNANGTGPSSAASGSVTPTGRPAAPGTVTDSTKPGMLLIKWTAPASTGGLPLTGYGVSCSSTDGGATLTASTAGTVTTATISDLADDTTYRCAVTAANSKGSSPATTAAAYVMHARTTASVASAVMQLPATKGYRLSAVASASTFATTNCTDYQSVDPNGTQLNDECFYKGESDLLDAATATATGTAKVILTPPAGVQGGAELAGYVFVDSTGTIAPGGTSAVSIKDPGQNAYRTFTGHTGEVISLDVPSTTIVGSVDVKDPGGDEIGYSEFSGSGFIDATTLTSNGTYTVFVDPTSGEGTATLHLYDVPTDTGMMTVGGPTVPIALTTPGENPVRTFTGTKGQKLSLDYTGNTIEGLLDVLASDDTEIGYGYLESGGATGTVSLTIPAAGTYHVVVNGAGDATGKIVLKLH